MDTPASTSYPPASAPASAPVQTPQSAVPPSKPSSSKHVVLVALAVLAVLAGAAYAWMQLNPAAPAESPSPSPTATATADPTADWKTYTNSEYGFQLMFPDEWAGYSVTRRAVQRSDFPSGASFDSEFEKQKDNVSFSFIVKDGERDYTVFAITAYSRAFWETVKNEPLFISGRLGEKNGFVFVVNGAHEPPLDPKLLPLVNQVDQILSTFKFTDDTANWKTYTNTQYGFEVKYPATFVISATFEKDQKLTIVDPQYEGTDRYEQAVTFWVSPSGTVRKGTPIVFAGRTAYQERTNSQVGGEFQRTIIPLESVDLIIDNGYTAILSQILSTFRFTN